MLFEKFPDLDTLNEERRRAVRQSLQSITLKELRQLMKEDFSEFEGDPWLEKFLLAMEAHQHGNFYRALSPEGVILLYCREEDLAIGVLPHSGMGPLPELGKQAMKEAIGLPVSGDKKS